jgi:molecular chaperone HtpG
MAKGKINVHTENIFPIIKKFLYSDHEIFLRELVSNAVDATQKLKTLNSMGEAKGELGDLAIEISIDETNKTLTIKDKGVGMTAEEVEKYITEIAFSGAEEFVQKYKDESKLIGHFGLGFYSAFMVSDKVEIFTKSFKEGTEGVHWICDGSTEYSIEKGDKTERGTEIVLHINADSVEFLEKARIETLLKKYCKFLPVEIKFNAVQINNTTPAWTKKPTELSDEDYKNFYKELYPFTEDPLFHIHLNVDYPFNLTGILYFPKLKPNLEVQKNKIQLYSNQVFVTDSVEGIVPDFLTLMHGILDSPDIPLNVSRSYLQADANVKKISNHITKKVSDKLEELFKKDRADFESKWESIRVFIQYGMLSDEKFAERAMKFVLLKNTDGTCYTIEEYQAHVKPTQTDKENKLVILYTNNAVEQHSFIQNAKGRGYDVLVMDSPLDSHFVNMLEQKIENVSLVRVDADTIDKLVNKEESQVSLLTDEQKETLKPIIESQVKKDQFTILFENLSPQDQPMLITRPEFMRRMKDMAAMGGGGGMSFMGEMPETYNLVVNANHPLVNKILLEQDADKQNKLARQAADLALLSQNLLKGEELTNFIKRSLEMIEQ